MIEGYSPVVQALQGTLFTWFLTALGAAVVFVFSSAHRRLLDGSLGFAAGVMLAASYWSLLDPAISMAIESGYYGNHYYLPVAVGFALGPMFVFFADALLQRMGTPTNVVAAMTKAKSEADNDFPRSSEDFESASSLKRRRARSPAERNGGAVDSDAVGREKLLSWKRILLLILAITVHNIPEGLAVGVGFGAAGKSSHATFESARNLAIGIGIQNFPEGLAVSLPLRGAGVGVWKSFWYGQLSGMVEPVAGVLGAVAVSIAEPLLPYALSFAAGAMVWVVNDDIIPESQCHGNGKLSSIMSIVGFIVMMVLDVTLG